MRNYKNSDTRTGKPVVASQTGANKNFQKWLKETSYHELYDADGLKWNLELKDRQIPDPHDVHLSIWYVTIDVWTSVRADHLIETGTLERLADARLIAILGSDIVKMQMKPTELRGQGLEIVRSKVVEKITLLREQFARKSLHMLKRQLVGRWIDQKKIFGSKKLP